MIFNAIINIFYWFISTVIGWLPTAEILPAGINTAIQAMANFMSMMIDIIPALDVIPQTIGIILAFEGALFIWGISNWTINKLRGSG